MKFSIGRRGIALVLFFVATIGITWMIASNASDGRQKALSAKAPEETRLLANVERRELRDEITLRGTVVSEFSVEVPTPTPGGENAGNLVTQTPLTQGAEVNRGTSLVEIAGRPLFLMTGDVPMYRDLHVNDSGKDVEQLQNNLTELGYRTYDRRGIFGPSTALALTRLYNKNGYAPSTEPQAAQPIGDAPANQTLAQSQAQQQKRVMLLRSEVFFVKQLPLRIDKLNVTVGQAPVKSIATLHGGKLRVRSELNAMESSLVSAGQEVSVEIAGSEFQQTTIADVRSETQTGSTGVTDSSNRSDGAMMSEQSQSKFAYVDVANIDASQQNKNVILRVLSKKSDGSVLVVPSSAIATRANGTSFVSIAEPNSKKTREVDVSVGMSTSGFFEIRPINDVSIAEGTQVVVSSR